MMIAAGILIGVPEDIFAQTQPKTNPSTQQSQGHANHGATQNATKGGKKSMSHNAADANFVKKASESNLAEIKLSELAMQKSSSDKVKEYAQMMIQHHTTAQTELASIVSTYTSSNSAGSTDSDANDADKMSSTGGTGGTTGNTQADGKTNGQYNSNMSSKDKADATNATNASGGTTATGSTYSSGNAGGAVGTTGSQEGKSADGAASQNTPSNESNNSSNSQADANSTTNPSMSGTRVGRGQLTDPNNTSPVHGNDANNTENESDATGGGGAGANSGGTTSSMSSGRVSRTTPETQGNSQDMNNSANSSTAAGGTNMMSSTMKYDLPNELSAEHKALRDKLAKLSGAEFDKEYIQAMVKDHAKSVQLFEKHALVSNEGDSQLQAFASKTLPLIKEHYEKAKALSGDSSMNSTPKNKGSK
jgi:putative membrane protein